MVRIVLVVRPACVVKIGILPNLRRVPVKHGKDFRPTSTVAARVNPGSDR
jgi:hypothetical protein